MSQQSLPEGAAGNVLFLETANMSSYDIFKGQLGKANEEYQRERGELEKLQERVQRRWDRINALRRGTASEDFQGEKAGLEHENARLEFKEKQVEERLRLLLLIRMDCVGGIREAASQSNDRA